VQAEGRGEGVIEGCQTVGSVDRIRTGMRDRVCSYCKDGMVLVWLVWNVRWTHSSSSSPPSPSLVSQLSPFCSLVPLLIASRSQVEHGHLGSSAHARPYRRATSSRRETDERCSLNAQVGAFRSSPPPSSNVGSHQPLFHPQGPRIHPITDRQSPEAGHSISPPVRDARCRELHLPLARIRY
jgi:hypothetical protein